MWRNWQTRWVQVSVLAREWRFKSSHPHHTSSVNFASVNKIVSSQLKNLNKESLESMKIGMVE
jgi:hypothetical protein